MVDSNIKISVIMPVYNSGDYLKLAVESVLNQDLREIELIIVDDGSTDGSSERCDEYMKVDSRVVVIHQKNEGICKARNVALKIARGDYIGFLDHDDEYKQGYLQSAYKKAIETNADIVKVSKKVLVTLDGALVKERSNCLPNEVWGKNEIKDKYFDLFTSYKINCVWDSLFKASFLKNYNILFDEFYKCGGEDYDIMARYLPFVSVIATMSDQFYIHYVRKGISTSSKYNPYKILHTQRLIQVIYDNAYKLGVHPEKIRDKSNLFLTEFYINGVASLLTSKGCDKTLQERKKIMHNLFYIECMSHGYNSSSSLSLFRKSPKIGLAYFFYKHNFINCLLFMHYLRNIQLNSHILNKL